ncbi:carbohydrate ABC transporter permease [Vallitalea okinawensis]|uniref:carbohydrate ABC transporter permease n=1 Tax=Vallitalea okinawensis TaxID=2078660 RepID=UPI000CFC9DDA|nr:sugar ABC transporter permease [Vallitalea okinawensis]
MDKKRNLYIAIFLMPAIIIFVIIYLIPVYNVITTSFLEWNLFVGDKTFIGLDNYINAFTNDSLFMASLKNTLIWVVLQGTFHVGLGTMVALFLADKPKMWKFMRVSYMLPNMISGAAFAIILLNIYNPEIGLINQFISFLGVENFQQNWFFDTSTAFFAVTMTWLPYAGLVAILVLAEIMSIPTSLYEAAAIAGATKFQQKLYVTLPLLKNIIGTCVLISATSMLKEFEHIYLTTNGGPGSTTLSLPLYLYKTALIENNYAYANTMGTILVIIGFLIIFVINKLFVLGHSDR